MKTKDLIPKIAKKIARLYTEDGWKFKNMKNNGGNITKPKLTVDLYKNNVFLGTLTSINGLKEISFAGPKADIINEEILITYGKADWLKDTSIDDLFRQFGGVRYTLIQLIWIKSLQDHHPGDIIVCYPYTKRGGLGFNSSSIWFNLNFKHIPFKNYDFEDAIKEKDNIDLRIEIQEAITSKDGFNCPIYEDFLVLFNESPQSKIYELYD